MKPNLILLLVVIGLFLGISLVMQAIYGQSYGFLSGDDSWIPDGNGGWMKHGNPTSAPPVEPSKNVPLWAHYLPIIVPGLVLAVFLFSPLGRKLEERKPGEDHAEKPSDSDAPIEPPSDEA